jgi:hypothetical protein
MARYILILSLLGCAFLRTDAMQCKVAAATTPSEAESAFLTTHIDYRDGLVKFDYDPKRGYTNLANQH